MSNTAKPLIFLTPLSETLQKLKEVMEENAEEDGVEIFEVDDLDEFGQLITTIGTSLTIAASPKKLAHGLQKNKKAIQKAHSKVILLSPKDLPKKLVEKLEKFGLTEYLVEPIPAKRLHYKVKFLLRSIKVEEEDEGEDTHTFNKSEDNIKDDEESHLDGKPEDQEKKTNEEYERSDVVLDDDSLKGNVNQEDHEESHYSGKMKKNRPEINDEISMDIYEEIKHSHEGALNEYQEDSGDVLKENGHDKKKEGKEEEPPPKDELNLEREKEEGKKSHYSERDQGGHYQANLEKSEEDKKDPPEENSYLDSQYDGYLKGKNKSKDKKEDSPSPESPETETEEEENSEEKSKDFDLDIQPTSKKKDEEEPSTNSENEENPLREREKDFDLDIEGSAPSKNDKNKRQNNEGKDREKKKASPNPEKSKRQSPFASRENTNEENEEEEEDSTSPELDIRPAENPDESSASRDKNKRKSPFASRDSDDQKEKEEEEGHSHSSELDIDSEEEKESEDSTNEGKPDREKRDQTPDLEFDKNKKEKGSYEDQSLDGHMRTKGQGNNAPQVKESPERENHSQNQATEKGKRPQVKPSQSKAKKKKDGEKGSQAEDDWDFDRGGDVSQSERKTEEDENSREMAIEKQSSPRGPEIQYGEEEDGEERGITYDGEEDLGEQTIHYDKLWDEFEAITTDQETKTSATDLAIEKNEKSRSSQILNDPTPEKRANTKDRPRMEIVEGEKNEDESEESEDSMRNEVYEPNPKGIDHVIKIADQYLAGEGEKEVIQSVAQTLKENYNADSAFFRYEKNSRSFQEELVSVQSPGGEDLRDYWDRIKKENYQNWRETSLPHWEDQTFQSSENTLVFPFFKGNQALGFVVILTKEALDEEKSQEIELMAESSRGIFLQWQRSPNTAGGPKLSTDGIESKSILKRAVGFIQKILQRDAA